VISASRYWVDEILELSKQYSSVAGDLRAGAFEKVPAGKVENRLLYETMKKVKWGFKGGVQKELLPELVCGSSTVTGKIKIKRSCGGFDLFYGARFEVGYGGILFSQEGKKYFNLIRPVYRFCG